MIHFKREVNGDLVKLIAFNNEERIGAKYINMAQRKDRVCLTKDLESFYLALKYEMGDIHDLKVSKIIRDW